jgi:hypothetical protein
MSTMSDSDGPARPRQVTLAAGVVVGASLFLVVSVFDAMTNLNSVDARDQLREFVMSSAGRDLGLSIDEAINGMRIGLSLTAVCAAAAAVLGVFVFSKHRGARIGLSVLAVPLVLTAPLTGGFLGVLVAVATAMLWQRPARDWYDGRPAREPRRRAQDSVQGQGQGQGQGHGRHPGQHPGQRPADRSAQDGPSQPSAPPARGGAPAEAPSTRETSSAPQATPGFGQGQPPPWAGLPPADPRRPYGQPWGPASRPGPGNGSGIRGVPRPVKIACVLTWVFGVVVALVYALALVTLLVARDQVVDYVGDSAAWQRSGLDLEALMPILWVGCLLFLAWSAGSMVLAWFTWRRHNWARYLLALSAGIALVVAVFAFPVGLVHQLACAVTIGTLFTARSRGWFDAPRQPPAGPPPGPGGVPPHWQQGPPGPPVEPGRQPTSSGRPHVW